MKKSSNLSIENIAKKAFTKSEFTFSDLWKLVSEENIYSGDDESSNKSEFYTDLVQNPNFINMGNNKWKLREFASYSDYQKNKSAMFGLTHLMEKELETMGAKDKQEFEVIEEELLDDMNQVDNEE